MIEKEKMIAGELYDANYNEDLIKERYIAKDKCYEYNQLKPSDHIQKTNIIKKLLGKTGNIFTIEQPFMCNLEIMYLSHLIVLFIQQDIL